MKPLVSVCMPVYNAENYLAQAIESVLQQTYEHFEFVIVDDCSTDTSWQIIQEYATKDKRIRAHRNTKNLDVVKTRNRIFSLCSKNTSYYAIFDSDDICINTRLQKEVEFLEQNPSHGIVGANTEIIDDEGKRIGMRTYPQTNTQIQESMIMKSPFAQPAAMIRKQALEEVDAYNEAYKRCQDYELWFRILQEYKGHNLQENLIRYRISTTQGKQQHLRLTLRNTARIQREWLFTKKYFTLKALYNHLLHYVALLLPKRFVLWVFRRRTYE